MLVKDNPHISIEDKDFFILLRIGLWQRAEEPLSDNPDWEYIYNLSIEQTVQGLIADGIGLYRKEHSELNISQEWNDKFLSASAQIVRQNFKVNQVQAIVCKLFNEHGLTYVVLKGQSVARYYPKPVLRCSGDIDFYFDDDNYEKAKQTLATVAISNKEDQNQQEKVFTLDDIVIELHASEGYYINWKEKFAKIKNKMLEKGEFDYFDCNGIKVPTAPAEYSIVYTFSHFIKHFYHTGISLRQICDWVILCNALLTKIDQNELQQYLKTIKMQSQWRLFMDFAESYLGLQVNIKQTSKANNFTVQIWNSCKKEGNFGHNNADNRESENKSKLARHIDRIKSITADSRKQWNLSPLIAIKKFKTNITQYILNIVKNKLSKC